MNWKLLLFIFSFGSLISCSPSLPDDVAAAYKTVPGKIDFNQHVKPILSDRCFKCHGPDGNQRKANLRLDIRENALAALKDNPSAHVIIPGNSSESEVYRRISSTDTSQRMPPMSSNLKLTDHEVDVIRRQGFARSRERTEQLGAGRGVEFR